MPAGLCTWMGYHKTNLGELVHSEAVEILVKHKCKYMGGAGLGLDLWYQCMHKYQIHGVLAMCVNSPSPTNLRVC